MKKKGVCKGCKYFVAKESRGSLVGTCEYMEATGRSRLVVEEENGGYKEDSCICYEAGKRNRRKKKINVWD